jgi:hypothetical protein
VRGLWTLRFLVAAPHARWMRGRHIVHLKSFNKRCDKGFNEDTERDGSETSEFRPAYYALTSANQVGNVAVQFFWLWPELGPE